MTRLALVVALAMLAGLAIVQSLVAAGLPYGRLVWGGGYDVLPRGLRIASLAAIALYLGFAALLLSRAGVLPGGDRQIVVVLTWVLAAYFAVGVVLNAMSRSPAERWTMTPVNVALAAATLVIALR